jgi:hypothetical protein
MVQAPGFHMIRFHGVFAGHAADRADVVPRPEPEAEASVAPPEQLAFAGIGEEEEVDDERAPSRKPWAWLLRHVFKIDVTVCPFCEGRMRWLDVRRGAFLALRKPDQTGTTSPLSSRRCSRPRLPHVTRCKQSPRSERGLARQLGTGPRGRGGAPRATLGGQGRARAAVTQTERRSPRGSSARGAASTLPPPTRVDKTAGSHLPAAYSRRQNRQLPPASRLPGSTKSPGPTCPPPTRVDKSGSSTWLAPTRVDKTTGSYLPRASKRRDLPFLGPQTAGPFAEKKRVA